jgi:hypothetical protein
LSPTLPRYAPSKIKLAVKSEPVKSRPAGMDGSRAAVYSLKPICFLTSKMRKNVFGNGTAMIYSMMFTMDLR